MNSDPKLGVNENRRGRAPLPRARPVAPPQEEELETGEPIPEEGEPLPDAKKIPALRGRFEARPTGQVDSCGPSHSHETSSTGGSSGGQVVLSSAKYLKTLPPEPASRRGRKGGCQEPEKTGQTLEGRVLNGGVGGGMLAMGVALVWFIAGLMNDVLYFYPPILFILGLIGFFKGMAGGDE